jgi:DNA-binding transcriptional ArsR family regulator
MMDQPEIIALDTSMLKALSHPLRMRLLVELREFGPSTATRLARRLDTSSGLTSYHLRELAAGGLIESDPDHDSARDRWWRSVHRGMSVDTSKVAGEEAVGLTAAYFDSVAQVYGSRIQRAVRSSLDLPEPWNELMNLSDEMLLLTPDETRALGEELWAVVGRYRKDPWVQAENPPDGADPIPEGVERVAVQVQIFPVPDSGQ